MFGLGTRIVGIRVSALPFILKLKLLGSNDLNVLIKPNQTKQNKTGGLKRWLVLSECLLSFQRTRFGSQNPLHVANKLLVAPAPKDPTPSSGFHMPHKHTYLMNNK